MNFKELLCLVSFICIPLTVCAGKDMIPSFAPCDLAPCGPMGTCVPAENNDYSCECQEGWTQSSESGPCEAADLCKGNPCGTGGTCEDLYGYYDCTCDANHIRGSTAAGEPTCLPKAVAGVCKNNPCGPAGDCQPVDDATYSASTNCSYMCDCYPGYKQTGTCGACRETDNPCKDSPCGPGGTCIQLLGGGYKCKCAPPYSLPTQFAKAGGYCTSSCDLSPCGPMGDCFPSDTGFTCQCEDGWEQVTPNGPCEARDVCKDNPCGEGGKCMDLYGDYDCSCSGSYTRGASAKGKATCLSKSAANACKFDPCGPAGECQALGPEEAVSVNCTFVCTCMPGYHQKDTCGPCYEIADPCLGAPCGKGGTCEPLIGGGYKCKCSPKYYLPEEFAHAGGQCYRRSRGMKRRKGHHPKGKGHHRYPYPAVREGVKH